MIEVSAAIIFDESHKILICKRNGEDPCAGLWEFPGGKKEPGETKEQCLVRECREELGVEISIVSKYDEFLYSYPHRDILFTFFISQLESGLMHMNVHDDIRWIGINEIDEYQFCPADEALVAKLKKDF